MAALAGCGSGAPSGASPARLAPTNTLFYLELTVRPQGAQHDAVESALTKVIGHSPDAAIQRAVGRLFQRAGVSYSKDIQPWLGQRIGIVLTGLSSPTDLGLIMPTNDPGAAASGLHRLLRRVPLRPASYHGVRYQIGSRNGRSGAVGIVSRAAVVATPSVFREIIDASRGHGLITTPGFRAALQALPAGSLVRGYADLSGAAAKLRPILGALPSSPGLQAVAPMLERLKGTVGFAMSAQPRAFVFSARSTAAHPSQGPDVSALPEPSWLALAGGTHGHQTMAMLNALRGNPAFAAVLSSFRSRTGLDLIRDVLPALERVELSVQGTSPITLGAGVLVTPSNPAAGRRLLGGIVRLASRSPSLQVLADQHGFSITRRGSLLPRVLLTQFGSRLVATLDETVADIATPSAPLSSNPRFVAARSQLPRGSRVSMFLDFRALSQLLANLPSFRSNPRNARVLAVAQRLDYLVLGSAGGQSRLVLALR